MENNARQLRLMGPPHSIVVGHCSGGWEMMGWALAAELYTNLDFLIMKFSINKIIIIGGSVSPVITLIIQVQGPTRPALREGGGAAPRPAAPLPHTLS